MCDQAVNPAEGRISWRSIEWRDPDEAELLLRRFLLDYPA